MPVSFIVNLAAVGLQAGLKGSAVRGKGSVIFDVLGRDGPSWSQMASLRQTLG